MVLGILYSVRDKFQSDVSGAVVGVIFTDRQSERK